MDKTVDIYIRVSRVGSREHMQSPSEQERDARRFADAQRLSVGLVVKDIDKSGGSINRAGLQAILGRVERRESAGVVVSYLSRFSRDTIQGLSLLDRITAAGGAVYAPNLPDYTSPDGRMLTTIQLAIDSGYRERKGAELERAKERAIENGIPVITRPAVGLRQREDRRLEPDPKIAPIIRALFERRAQGAGPVELAQILESAGIRTSQGSATWSKPAIYGLLSNRIYIGELSYGKDRRYVNPASVEPIVDLALFMAAQHPDGRRLQRSGAATSLLTGLLRCYSCGYALQATRSSHGHPIYRCTRRHAGGECPAPVRTRAEPVERRAVEAFWALQRDLEAHGHQDTTPDIAGLERALAATERRLEQYSRPDVQDAIGDAALWAAGLRERREQRDTAAAELGAARTQRPNSTPIATETLRGAWERMSTADRRELLALRFDTIALRRDAIVTFPSGTAPGDLPRRGYKRSPVLRPFGDLPAGARVLAL